MPGCGLVVVAGSGSGVGKTWLAELLSMLLSAWGYCVAGVKHVHHGVDYRVKDTGRLLSSGMARVVAVGPGEFMVVERRRLGFWEAVELAASACRSSDGRGWAVVVEGFRGHLSEALAWGGCGAYLAPGKRVEIAYSQHRIRVEGSYSAAARVLAGLVAEGYCQPRVDRECFST